MVLACCDVMRVPTSSLYYALYGWACKTNASTTVIPAPVADYLHTCFLPAPLAHLLLTHRLRLKSLVISVGTYACMEEVNHCMLTSLARTLAHSL